MLSFVRYLEEELCSETQERHLLPRVFPSAKLKTCVFPSAMWKTRVFPSAMWVTCEFLSATRKTPVSFCYVEEDTCVSFCPIEDTCFSSYYLGDTRVCFCYLGDTWLSQSHILGNMFHHISHYVRETKLWIIAYLAFLTRSVLEDFLTGWLHGDAQICGSVPGRNQDGRGGGKRLVIEMLLHLKKWLRRIGTSFFFYNICIWANPFCK